MLYLIIAPIVILNFYKNIGQVISSIEARNIGKLKADIFFLVLSIIVTILLVLAIEWK